MKYHEMKEQDIEKVLNTDFSNGLSSSDARKRMKQQGFNELDEGEKQSAILLFFSQFKDFMVLVLLGAVLISGLLGEYIDAIAIIAIVIINGFLGFFPGEESGEIVTSVKRTVCPTCHGLARR